jgi:hypothetical protein
VFDNGSLVRAANVEIPRHVADKPDGQRWLIVAVYIEAWLGVDAYPSRLIFERPQWYAREKSKGDPNQLAGVVGVASMLVGRLSKRWAHALLDDGCVLSPTPAEWIGQIPKTCPACKANRKKCPVCKGSAWNTPRGKRIRSRLSDTELALVPDQNDAIDAVGLGLFALGRLTPKTVLSNGRDGR